MFLNLVRKAQKPNQRFQYIKTEDDDMLSWMLRRTSSWNIMLRIAAWMIRWITTVRKRVKNQETTTCLKVHHHEIPPTLGT